MAEYIGQQFGNYRLVSLLGQGGFADVYLGQHIHLGTPAAIKILQLRLVESKTDLFFTEARTIARLIHPHIVRVLDFGVQDSIPFLVMDYAPGGTLRQRYFNRHPLPPAAIVPYMKQVAEALQYAHDRKLIHRDIKPENILLAEDGKVLLSDFGLVLVAHSSGSRSTQEMAGTVMYMAPEQLQGQPRQASDQYGLAVVVYEWVTGAPPFQGAFLEVASQHMLTPPPPLREKVPSLSPEFEQVVLTALAKDPHQRFASVTAFAQALEHAIQPFSPLPLADQTALPTFIKPTPVDSFQSPVITPSASHTSQEAQVLSQSSQPTFIKQPSLDGAQPTLLSPAQSTVVKTPSSPPYNTPPIQSPLQHVQQPQYSSLSPNIPAVPQTTQRRRFPWMIVLLLLLIVGSSTGIFYLSSSNRSIGQAPQGTPTLSGHGRATATVTTTTAPATPTPTTVPAGGQAQETPTAPISTPTPTPVTTATLTPTSIPTPTATVPINSNPYPPYSGTLVLNDALTDNSQGHQWHEFNDTSVGNSCQFNNGAYHMVEVANYGGSCLAQATNFSNFAFQVQMTFLKYGKQFSGGGLVFRGDSATSKYYVLEIFESGRYTFYSCAGNDCSHGIAGYPNQPEVISSFHTGLNQTNTIAVVANGNTFTFYANGVSFAGPITDTTYTQGMIGFYAEGGSEGGPGATTDVAYSNAKVWQF